MSAIELNRNLKNQRFEWEGMNSSDTILINCSDILESRDHLLDPIPLANIEIVESKDRSRIGYIDWPELSERYIQCEFVLIKYDHQKFSLLYDELQNLNLPIFQIRRQKLSDGSISIIFKIALCYPPFPNEPAIDKSENKEIDDGSNAVKKLEDCFLKLMAKTTKNQKKLQMRTELSVWLDTFDRELLYKKSSPADRKKIFYYGERADELYKGSLRQVKKKIKAIEQIANLRKKRLNNKSNSL